MDEKELTLDDRIRDAVHRIESLYNETNGKCYISFSGGKDSTVLLALIKLCEEVYTIPPNSIPAVFSNTGIEMDAIINFVYWIKDNYYPNLTVIRPEKSFDWVLKNEGKPIRSKIRSKDLRQWHSGNRTETLIRNMIESDIGNPAYRHTMPDRDMHMLHDEFPIAASSKCCDWLKKKPLVKYAKDHGLDGVLLGLRLEEGGARESAAIKRTHSGGSLCTWTKNGIINKAPIIDWDDDDIAEFIERYKVPVSEVYTKYGFDRTGCIACPFALPLEHNLEYLFYNEPVKYKAAMHWLKDVYIAQDVSCPYDDDYERDRIEAWKTVYTNMRKEMLEKYRPDSHILKTESLANFDGRADNISIATSDITEPMNILVAYDNDQMLCNMFRQRGHNAFSCDKELCTGGFPKWHIREDASRIINGDCSFSTQDGTQFTQNGPWDLIVAMPSCTYLAKGGAARLFRKEEKYYPSYGTFQMINPERLKEGIIERDSFMEIFKANCEKILIINPVLMKIFAIPEPTQTIQPYQFGDPYKKQTCLWAKGLPPLQPTDIVEPERNWINAGSKYSDGSKRETAITNNAVRMRGKIFPGIAKAIVEQYS